MAKQRVQMRMAADSVIQVLSIHNNCCSTGVTIIMDAKNLYDGISRLLETSSAARELPKPVNNGKAKGADENGDVPAAAENGETTIV
ncbi:uncharacterized protein DS421_20g688650 [Arachis hypogaea]|nr:uncharacterized protein DS421_20g688650 [Arachis hypogaea]